MNERSKRGAQHARAKAHKEIRGPATKNGSHPKALKPASQTAILPWLTNALSRVDSLGRMALPGSLWAGAKLIVAAGMLSAGLEILSVPLWPLEPEIHPLFVDHSSSKEGLLFQVSNKSWGFPISNFSPECEVGQLDTTSGYRIRHALFISNRHSRIKAQGSVFFSCGLQADEGVVTSAAIKFHATYDVKIWGFPIHRSMTTDLFTWDGQRWIEGRPI